MSRLASFVQISDLHFGTPDPLTGNGSTSADVRVLASTIARFHGSLGHQALSLRQLQQSLAGLRAAGEDFRVLVTGDFTRCGDMAELSLAEGYLAHEVSLRPNTRPTGLRLGQLPDSVAGNHDHWGAYNSPFSTTATLFPNSALQPATGFPYIKLDQIYLGRQLVLIGIDSDADVLPGSYRRIFAHGHFVSQLNTLEQQIGANTSNELRVLLIHHARHARGTALRMSSASSRRLDAFCASRGISLVLSGHTHKPHAGAVARTMEVCCPSTTQIDEAPPGWVNIVGAAPTVRFEPNGFVIHRLHDDAGRIRWDAHVMIRDPAGSGFIEAKKNTIRNI